MLYDASTARKIEIWILLTDLKCLIGQKIVDRFTKGLIDRPKARSVDERAYQINCLEGGGDRGGDASRGEALERS